MGFNYSRRKKAVSILFLLPAVLVSLCFILYPIYTTFKLSFQDVRMISPNMAGAPFTLNNYARIFQNPEFWSSVCLTLLFTFTGTVVSFLLGLYTAMMLNRKFRGRALARSVVMFSWPIPAVAVSLIFIWMFNADFGIINQILRSLGVIKQNIAWLITPSPAMFAVLTAAIWKAFPFFTLMLLAGLQTIPVELYEASAIDGASRVQQFGYITLPGLLNVSVVSILLNGVWFFKNFDIIYSMTGGGPVRSTELLSIKLYIEGFQYYRMGVASAIGVVSLIICVIFIVVAAPFLDKEFY